AELEQRQQELAEASTGELAEVRQQLKEQEKANEKLQAAHDAAQAESHQLRKQLASKQAGGDEVIQLRQQVKSLKDDAGKQTQVHQQVARKFQTERDAALAEVQQLKKQQGNPAEVAQLRQQLQSLKDESARNVQQHEQAAKKAQAERDALQAEVQQLRKQQA